MELEVNKNSRKCANKFCLLLSIHPGIVPFRELFVRNLLRKTKFLDMISNKKIHVLSVIFFDQRKMFTYTKLIDSKSSSEPGIVPVNLLELKSLKEKFL